MCQYEKNIIAKLNETALIYGISAQGTDGDYVIAEAVTEKGLVDCVNKVWPFNLWPKIPNIDVILLKNVTTENKRNLPATIGEIWFNAGATAWLCELLFDDHWIVVEIEDVEPYVNE